MSSLTPDTSSRRRSKAGPTPVIQLPRPTHPNFVRSSYRLVIFAGFLLSFGGGFVASLFWRPVVQVVEAKTQIADFRIEIPEGQTTVTVLSRESDARELATLNIYREGDRIKGVPQVMRRIAPRARLTTEDSLFFKKELRGVFLNSDSQFDKANKIREWLVHRAYRLAMPGLSTRVAREAYQQMIAGNPVLCGNLADIYVALCDASGLDARGVGLSLAVQHGLFGIDTHAGAEVWIPEMGGWVYEDPTFNCYWTVDGKPASALAIHNAVMDRVPVLFLPHSRDTESRLRAFYIDPRLLFRHISYEYKPGGSLLYYADKRLEPLSVTDKNWIHTSEPLDIRRLDIDGNLVEERRGEIAPGIFAQLLDNTLFIRDRRERSPGIRVRSSTGRVEGCAYVHERAEELGLFAAINLAKNPSFRITGGSAEIANDWSISGPVEAMTVAGGQAMAALAGGRLWQRIQVRPYGKYLMYARVTVSRGLVNWSLSDADHGARSVGTIEPERVSEIISDIVESSSGYIDLAFDVPSGGAFRVMDVIVTEAPRFVPDTERLTVEHHNSPKLQHHGGRLAASNRNSKQQIISIVYVDNPEAIAYL